MKFGSFIFLFFLCAVTYGQRVNPFDIPQSGEKAGDVILLPATEKLDTSQITIESSGQTNEALIAPNSTPLQSNNPFDLPKQKSLSTKKPEPRHNDIKVVKNDQEPQNMKLIVLIYALVIMVILTLCIGINRKRFNSILKAGVNSNYLKTLYRDTTAWTNPQFIILYIYFILNLSFVTWLILLKSSIIVNLFILIGAVLSCYAIRHFVMWALTTIYPIGREADLHNYSIAIHNCILGILLLPVILVVEFIPGINVSVLGYLAIVVVGIIYFLRQSKGLLSSIRMRSFNLFYFFIYLCAIEIAPILVGYKMMIGAL